MNTILEQSLPEVDHHTEFESGQPQIGKHLSFKNIIVFCYGLGINKNQFLNQDITSYLYSNHVRIFDYLKFAQPFREQIRENAETLAKANGLTIEFIGKKTFRKEERIKKILKERGSHPGLVHIFSAMESCTTYKPWHDKATGKTFLRHDQSKCVHYYFYFLDEKLGLCYLRVPTWCPFRLQFYFNGHSLLTGLLTKKGIGFQQLENAFLTIADFPSANDIAQRIDLRKLHAKLDRIAQQCCPVVKALDLSYHWSVMQVEYSTDIIFKKRGDLQAIYPYLLETLVHSVKPENIATFLGQKLHGNYKGEVENNLDVRVLGTRIKHRMGPVCIKMQSQRRQEAKGARSACVSCQTKSSFASWLLSRLCVDTTSLG